MPIRYERLFETIHIGILVLDFKTRVISDANPYICELSGYTKKELVGKKISEVKLFDSAVSGKGIFTALKDQAEVIYENVPLVTKDGQTKTVEIGAHSYDTDSVKMVQCTVRDLTEKRLAQRELFEANQRLKALMDALPVGVTFSLDPECKIVTANPYMERMLELHPGAEISVTQNKARVDNKRELRHFMNGKEVKPKDLTMQRAIALNKQVGPFEIEVELPTGKRWLMEATGAPIRDRQGKVMGAVAVNVDLTERKKAENAEKLSQLVEQEKMKLDFIADAAHELRTPLAIIRGNVELALHKKASMEDALTAINVEVIHLTNLLSDLSLLTTKESDFRRKLSTRKVNLTKLVEQVAKRHNGLAHEKNISIEILKLPPARIVGDEYYLERLFTNIITNAISYGKQNGHIWVRGQSDGKTVKIKIEDDGIGISEKEIPNIFDRFFRADGSRSKDYGGSGLGLAIVKWITEAHNGKVSVESTPEKGSTFTVCFPIK
jgi:PAS domain S-box-containing protein